MNDWKTSLVLADWLPVLYAAGALAATGLLIWGWWKLIGWARGQVRKWQGTRIRAIRFQRVVLLSEVRIVALLRTLLGGLRWLGGLWLLGAWLVLALHFFPATQQLEEKLFDAVAEPLTEVALGVVHYLPKLLFIVFAVLLVRLLLRGIHFLFNQVALGNVRFAGFHKDWAEPTYQLVKMLVIVFLVIVIFPYLPAASSGAFKGISVFLGVLVSLGSSSAVGNIVSGVVLTYMRPYRVDDYVRVDGIEGRVIERSLLLTRLRTPQNEIVTLPNAQILSGQMVNYSTMAAGEGVILHMEVMLGYGLPWERVEALLLEAARRIPEIADAPAPYVMHTGFAPGYARYELNAYTRKALRLPYIYSDLRRMVQTVFAEAGADMTTPMFLAPHAAAGTPPREPAPAAPAGGTPV